MGSASGKAAAWVFEVEEREEGSALGQVIGGKRGEEVAARFVHIT